MLRECPKLTEWSRQLAHDIKNTIDDGMSEFGVSIYIEEYVENSAKELQEIINEEIKLREKIIVKKILKFLF